MAKDYPARSISLQRAEDIHTFGTLALAWAGGFQSSILPHDKGGQGMKRLILKVAVMLVTFAFGIGIHWLIEQPQPNNAPPPQVEAISLAPVELQRESVPPPPPVPAATPGPIFIWDSDRETLRSILYIMGRKPKEFADIESLAVVLEANGAHLYGHIEVYTQRPDNNGESATAIFALVTEKRMFFTTSQTSISGVEYRFDGKFLRTDFNAVDGKNIAVLRGTLTKTKNGRKIAEHTFNFRTEYLGC